MKKLKAPKHPYKNFGCKPTPAILLAHPPTNPDIIRYEAWGPLTGSCQHLHGQWNGALRCRDADRTEIKTFKVGR